jgi:hypothetical protein
MIGFIDTLYIQFGTAGNYSAIADLQTLQFTVTHVLGFSVFTSRILVPDLLSVSRSFWITHEVFSQPDSFLAIILQLPILKTRLNLIPLLPSSHPGTLASRNSTLHWTASTELFFITTLHGPRRTHILYCWWGVFTAPLHNNGGGADLHRKHRSSIVARGFVVAGICLRSRCQAMNVYSGFRASCHIIIKNMSFLQYL